MYVHNQITNIAMVRVMVNNTTFNNISVISSAFHSIRETGQIAGLIAFFSGYFVFKNESVKLKYGFVLHAGLSFAM
jgi:uncharacterized membrane protein